MSFQGFKQQLLAREAKALLGVATLALGSRPKQGLAKVQAKSEPENHISYSRECKRV
jgi:hypothetical protein